MASDHRVWISKAIDYVSASKDMTCVASAHSLLAARSLIGPSKSTWPCSWYHRRLAARQTHCSIHHEAPRLHLEKLVILVVELDTHSVEAGRGIGVLEAEHVRMWIRWRDLLRAEEEFVSQPLTVVVDVILDIHTCQQRGSSAASSGRKNKLCNLSIAECALPHEASYTRLSASYLD